MGLVRDMPSASRRWFPLLVVGAALAASLTSLGNGFALDDLPIVLQNGRVHSLASPWAWLVQTYWPPEHGAALYRPLVIAGFAIQWTLGHGSPLVFHLVNVLLYAAASLAVFWLARQLLPEGAALVAALYFAVQPVHVEAVGNIVGQSELLVGLLLALGVGVYVRQRGAGAVTVRGGIALTGLYLLALMAKEHALVSPALLVLAELLLVERPDGLRARFERLIPLYLALGTVAVSFWTVRTMVTGGTIGRDWHPAFRTGEFSVRLWTSLGVIPDYLRLLLFPAHLSADYNPQEIPVAAGPGLRPLLGLAVLLVVGAVVVWAWRRKPVVAFGLLWCSLAIFPVSNLLIPTGILLAERTLFLPSVGFALALGGAVALLASRWKELGVAAQRLLPAGLALLVLAGIARSALRQPVWKDNATLFEQTALDAPQSYRARAARAVLWIEAGREAEGEREYRAALELYRDDPNLFADFGNYYVRKARYADALPLYQRVLELVPDHWSATSRSILCLIQLGRLEEARHLAQVATHRGDEGAAAKLAYVDSLLAHRPDSTKALTR